MTHRRTSKRRIAIATTGAAALLAGSFGLAQASASSPASTPTPDTLSSEAASDLATTLAGELGQEVGTFYDAESSTLVVNVTDQATADTVREAGAEARVVDHTMAELNSVKAEVSEFAVPGTSWFVDPVSNTVKVTTDSTVTGADLQQVQDAVAEFGDMATLEQTEGEFQSFIAGGDAIYSSGARCSLGFNVDGGSGFLTAGHCGGVGSSWSASSGGSPLGQMSESVFPGADYALVEYSSSTDAPSEVNLYNGSSQEITEAGEATVGQSVQRSGSTTQVHDGEVTGLDVSVSYPEGTVNGMIQTTVCAEPGDSGGALFDGTTALGITSGGSGNCTIGGQTFYYPVTDALAATGTSIP